MQFTKILFTIILYFLSDFLNFNIILRFIIVHLLKTKGQKPWGRSLFLLIEMIAQIAFSIILKLMWWLEWQVLSILIIVNLVMIMIMVFHEDDLYWFTTLKGLWISWSCYLKNHSTHVLPKKKRSTLIKVLLWLTYMFICLKLWHVKQCQLFYGNLFICYLYVF